MDKPIIYIGLDTGVQTGIAVWNVREQKFIKIDTVKIHRAMEMIKQLNLIHSKWIFVRVEDARLRTWFGKSGREKLQGAGSVKRDAKIWEDFLTDNGIPFELMPPKNNKTKMSSIAFKKLTGWQGRASEHGRDAALLIYGINK